MKLTRYDGHVPLFSQDMEGRERTLFGSTVQDDDINNQFTPEFLRGWGSVGSTEFPTLQDFNALAYTHNKLLSYLYQAGIPSYSQNEEYYIGSIVQYNKDIYICLRDKPAVLPTDTNAWKRVQESLTFVGDGPEVMRRGAYGLGGYSAYNGDFNDFYAFPTDHNELKNFPIQTGFYTFSKEMLNGWKNNGESATYTGQLEVLIRRYRAGDEIILKAWESGICYINIRQSGQWKGWFKDLNENNTRTDKNNVLHAGTSTPINTLNVSDMSQQVINNDLLTVTSGAVYRALQQKADLTYVNTELNKKANLTYVNSELLKKADKTYVDSELLNKADLTYVDTELDKKITGGNVVQTTGQSAVDVMSQKAVTDELNKVIGSANSFDEFSMKTNFVYTNTENKVIAITVSALTGTGSAIEIKIGGVKGPRYSGLNDFGSVMAFIPKNSTYELVTVGSVSDLRVRKLL